MCRERERERRTLTRVFLDELVDMDPGAGAPSVKHDPIENSSHVDRRGGFRYMLEHLRRAVGLRCRMHDFRHRMENLWYGVDDLGCRMEDLRDHGKSRDTGLRDLRHRVGDLRKEVFPVGGVLPVAVIGGDVPVVPVVSRLGEEASSQEADIKREEQAWRGHCFHSRREE